MNPAISFSVKERFMRYVTIDTQSDPASDTCPSTEKQKDLGRLLVSEMQEMGIADAHMDANGYVYGTIESTSDKPDVPVIFFCSHMDTSPDCSGRDVKPVVHSNYRGQDLVLPDDATQVIRMKDHPDLKEQIGNDIITAGGKTLLGADNKAGLAEIMDAAAHLVRNPGLKHGTIKLFFTPDEEIGRGVNKADLEKLGADFGYTVDGETLGSVENETFSADGLTLKVYGVSSHPGFARGKMESAIKIISDVISRLPKDRYSPESTDGKEGFIHPVSLSGSVEEAACEFIIRDFDDERLQEYEDILRIIVKEVLQEYPNSDFSVEVKEQYRNMKNVLDQHPHVVDYAVKAVERSGLKPKLRSIRGGTDGSRLSFMGLPCPNIFAGEHAFHGKHEWVSVQDMQKAVETIVNLALICEEETPAR